MKRTDGLMVLGDRYVFDFQKCKNAKGWAQLDTRQDASYYGNWVNPVTLAAVSYCEGDVTVLQYETEAEFAQGLLETLQWHQERDYNPKLDPGFNPAVTAAFKALGFAEWLH